VHHAQWHVWCGSAVAGLAGRKACRATQLLLRNAPNNNHWVSCSRAICTLSVCGGFFRGHLQVLLLLQQLHSAAWHADQPDAAHKCGCYCSCNQLLHLKRNSCIRFFLSAVLLTLRTYFCCSSNPQPMCSLEKALSVKPSPTATKDGLFATAG
jgi:hypothetical protein